MPSNQQTSLLPRKDGQPQRAEQSMIMDWFPSSLIVHSNGDASHLHTGPAWHTGPGFSVSAGANWACPGGRLKPQQLSPVSPREKSHEPLHLASAYLHQGLVLSAFSQLWRRLAGQEDPLRLTGQPRVISRTDISARTPLSHRRPPQTVCHVSHGSAYVHRRTRDPEPVGGVLAR